MKTFATTGKLYNDRVHVLQTSLKKTHYIKGSLVVFTVSIRAISGQDLVRLLVKVRSRR